MHDPQSLVCLIWLIPEMYDLNGDQWKNRKKKNKRKTKLTSEKQLTNN